MLVLLAAIDKSQKIGIFEDRVNSSRDQWSYRTL